MMGFYSFFPLLWVYLVMTINFEMRVSLDGVVAAVSLTGGASSRVRGINPIEVKCVAPVMVGGPKYQIGIANDKFGNTTMGRTCCDTKIVGG